MDTSATNARGRVVFLDRDGVINQPPPDGSWVLSWSEFRFADGALDALRRLHDAGYVCVVVTNQSCVGRGLLDRGVVDGIHEKMVGAIEDAGGRVTAVYVCPHVDADECTCRKPKPGMIVQAASDLGVDPATGWLVGDSERDIECGAAMGCTTYIVERPDKPPRRSTTADHEVFDLAEAVDAILAGEGSMAE